MPVTPPLDIIPGLPAKGVSILSKEANKLIKKIGEKIGETLQDAIQLPDDCNCDDPRIHDIKDKIEDAKEMIAKVQEIVAVIKKVHTGLQTAMGIANAIKSAIFLVPVTGVAALQAELMMVQNMTIANGVQAIKQIDFIPPTMEAGMSLINNQLASIISKLGGICNNETFDVSADVAKSLNGGAGNAGGSGGDWRLVSGSGDCGKPLGVPPSPKSPYTDSCGGVWVWFGSGYYNPDGIGWGTQQSRIDDSTMGTEVYSDINVSDEDLNTYSKMIDNLVKNQQDLLTSLQEAPAQSYNGTEPPNSNLGKSGDYYIDTTAQKMYGPKTSEGWPPPVNY